MPENDRLSGCLDEINLEFVEREATPQLLIKLSIQLHLSDYRFRILFHFLSYLVLNRCDLPFITGFIRPIYSQNLVGVRITLRLMRP